MRESYIACMMPGMYPRQVRSWKHVRRERMHRRRSGESYNVEQEGAVAANLEENSHGGEEDRKRLER